MKISTTYLSLLTPLHKKVPHNRLWSHKTLQELQDMIAYLKETIEFHKTSPCAINVTEQQLIKMIEEDTTYMNKLQDKVNYISQYPELNDWYELIKLMYDQVYAYYLMDSHARFVTKYIQENKPLPYWCNLSYFTEKTWDKLTNHQCQDYLPYKVEGERVVALTNKVTTI